MKKYDVMADDRPGWRTHWEEDIYEVKADSALAAAQECLGYFDPDDEDYMPKSLWVREYGSEMQWEEFAVEKSSTYRVTQCTQPEVTS